MRFESRLALLALATVLASGCGRSDEDGGVGSGNQAAAAPGVTETAIKLGGSYPFSGPASAYASIASGVKARFAAENAKGGVNGRKIDFVALDDGYEPQRAVTNARRLVEQEKVFALFNTLGTPNNLAIWDYLNQQKVPQLYVATGASAFGADVGAHPFTTGWQPDYVSEAKAYAEFLKAEKPKAKVAVLFQNDGFGKDLLGGFEKAIEGSDVEIVVRESYEVTDPTISSQMRKLASSGGDTFLNITTPKFSAQAIAAIAKSDWKPLHILNNVGASKKLVLEPVGLENAMRDENRAAAEAPFCAYGWTAASTMIEALKAMKEPTREALMGAVRNMDVEIPMLLPGVKVTTSGNDDGYPIQATQIMKFNGENWELQGDVIEAG